MATLFFRLTPRPLYAIRASMLRLFGAQIGKRVQVSNTAKIFAPWNLRIGDYTAIGIGANLYNLGNMDIGSNVTVSQGAHLCGGTHDYLDPAMKLIKKPIVLKDNCWVCADAFVGPGVTIGESAVVAARAVCIKDVPGNTVVGGNPAREIKKREV